MKVRRRFVALAMALFLVAGLIVGLPVRVDAGTLTSAAWTTSTPYVGAPQSTYNYGFTTATAATLGSVRMAVPTGTTAATRYLDVNGASGNYASTPDSVANSITGDLDIRVDVAMSNWIPSAGQYPDLVAKVNASDAYQLVIQPTTGDLLLQTSSNGSSWTVTAGSTAAPSASNGTSLWLRATLKANNGSGGNTTTFYTSADGTSWTQLGSSVVNSGTTSIYDSTDNLDIGSSYDGMGGLLSGKVYYSDIRNVIQGTSSASGCTTTNVVVCFNPNDDLPGSTTWTSSSTQQEVWTLNRSGTNLPADISADLTVNSYTGLGAGTAKLRQIDGQVYYTITSPASVFASTGVTLSIGGIINSQQRGNQTSSITTYDTTPTAVDSATTGNLLFVNPVSMGANSNCILSSNGTPQCWGQNFFGELGNNTYNPSPYLQGLSGGPYTWSDISAGSWNACGLNTSGAAYCWGDNWGGGVGDGTTTTRKVPTAVTGGHTFAMISGGGNVTSCGVTPTGAGYCWGNNGNGEVGDGTTTNRSSPTLVAGGLTWSAIETSNSDTTCGLTTTGVAYCWGNNTNGEVGNGTSGGNVTTPTAVSGGFVFASISVGNAYTCALTPSGASYCWGTNSNGQLGNGTTTQETTPTAVSGGLAFATVATGGNQTTCATTTANAGYCWGGNGQGQLGDGNTTQQTSPALVTGSHTFEVINSGSSAACGLTNNGAYYCWGDDSQDQLGSATITQNVMPVAVTGGLSFASISVGVQDACGVTTTGAGYCWGYNSNGQVGDNTTTTRASPTLVSGGYTWASISTGNAFTCGVTTGNVGYCWGQGGSGEIGNGLTNGYKVPTAVSGGLSFSSIVAGYQSACGVTTTGAGYCWGANGNGQLGIGNTTQQDSPTAVSGSLTFANISAPIVGQTTCGVTTGNAGYCWGTNGSGQLGDGNTTQQTSPVAVSGGLSFSWISVGGYGTTGAQTCGVTTAGTGYCWGSDSDGQMGNSAYTGSYTPYAVSGGLTFGTSSGSMSAGTWSGCGVTSGNAGYCWGYNGGGRLGSGNELGVYTGPAAVGGGLSFSSISTGEWFSCGVTTSHGAYCWGNNDYGNLGTGTTGTMTSTPMFLDNPSAAASLQQAKTNTTVISTGAWTNQSSVVVSAVITDPDTEFSDTGALCVEFEPLGTGFANTGTCSSQVSSGSTASVTISGLVDGTQYHWQAQTKDSEGGYSLWSSYGGNSESSSDVGVDLTAPSAGSVSLTTTSSLSSVSGTIAGFSDASSGTPSGIASYSYALGTTSGGTDVVGWTSNGASTSVNVSSLSLRTTQPYYLSVTATDNAGNTSTVATSPMKLVLDSGTFSSSQPSVVSMADGGSASVSSGLPHED